MLLCNGSEQIRRQASLNPSLNCLDAISLSFGDKSLSLIISASILAAAKVAATTVTLTSSNAATIDFDEGNSWTVDLGAATGSVTLSFTHYEQGACYFIRVKQKSSSPVNIGTYQTLDLGGGSVLFPAGTAPTITTTSNAVDTLVLYCDESNNLLVNFSQNYS